MRGEASVFALATAAVEVALIVGLVAVAVATTVPYAFTLAWVGTPSVAGDDAPPMIVRLFSETGLDFGALPRDKANYRKEGSYRSFYTASSRDLVASRFAQTIALLGYEF